MLNVNCQFNNITAFLYAAHYEYEMIFLKKHKVYNFT